MSNKATRIILAIAILSATFVSAPTARGVQRLVTQSPIPPVSSTSSVQRLPATGAISGIFTSPSLGALTSNFGLSGRLWAYDAALSNAPMRVWDLSTESLVTTFVPRDGNGRGVAFDPTDGNIWTTTVLGSFEGDGLIHKNPPLGGPDIKTIPDPGGVNGPGIGALDYDPEENVLWAAVYQPVNGQSKFYKLDPNNGNVLASCQMPFQGGGIGNDTLAIARPADLGGKKVLLTDGGELLTMLFAIDASTCAVVKTYVLPVGVTGIDVDDDSGDLIVTDVSTFYNLGPAPYNVIQASFPTQGLVEDISLEAKKRGPIQISADPYTNNTSFHKTEVEPHSFSFGSTIVSAFQAGRFDNGGASNIGWATSTNGGSTWQKDFLPGLTKYAGGSFDRASDPVVAYDAKHNVWLIASLGIVELPIEGPKGTAVLVSRSTNGGTQWDVPVVATIGLQVIFGPDIDKEWIVCDNTSSSPYYGRCYLIWTDFNTETVRTSWSSDGGLNWSNQKGTLGNGAAFGGQPVVQPNGTVIVPSLSLNGKMLLVFKSSNGGEKWTSPAKITDINFHSPAGTLRAIQLPSANIDSAGKVYVVWPDCRFETGCPTAPNDLLITTSSDGDNWSLPPRPIWIDPQGKGIDHFIPGLAVDPTTSGDSAHLGLTYYYYPDWNCTVGTCQLDVGFVSSTDGGTHWSGLTQLAAPMSLPWLPLTRDRGWKFFLLKGFMVGDYISTSFVGGKAYPFFALAKTPPCAGCFDEAIYTLTSGLMP